MIKNFCALLACLLTAGAAQADIVPLTLPATGNFASGSTFTTSMVSIPSAPGATFDIVYTLNAFATDTSVAPSITSQNGTIFGVASAPDGDNLSQQESIDANDGETLSITGLSITNFVPGTSGLTLSDLSISYDELTVLNGTARFDGGALSFVSFGDTNATIFDPITTADLTTVSGFSTTATDLFVETAVVADGNRWSISGISVEVVVVAVPEPGSFAMLGVIGSLLMIRRRKS